MTKFVLAKVSNITVLFIYIFEKILLDTYTFTAVCAVIIVSLLNDTLMLFTLLAYSAENVFSGKQKYY